MDGYRGDKQGIIKFYMDDEQTRVKHYRYPGERTRFIEEWMGDIKHLKDKHLFYYVVEPSQNFTRKWRKGRIRDIQSTGASQQQMHRVVEDDLIKIAS